MDALSRRPCTSCAYCEKREHEDKEDDMRCNKVSTQQVAIQNSTGQREITTESTENVLVCEENPSAEESQESRAFLSQQEMGPLDRGASVPMRKYVKDQSSVATNSLPFLNWRTNVLLSTGESSTLLRWKMSADLGK